MTCLHIFNLFIELFCLTMKTGVFERLHYKIITKNDFYYGSCPYFQFEFYLTVLQYISENCSYLLKVLLLIDLRNVSISRLDRAFFLAIILSLLKFIEWPN